MRPHCFQSVRATTPAASSPAQGVLLRHSKSYSVSKAQEVAGDVGRLTAQARHVVRDLEPRNDLELFRLRGKEREILVAPGPDFMMFVVQRWRVAQSEA